MNQTSYCQNNPKGYPVKGEEVIVQFATTHLREICNDDRLATKRLGARRASSLRRRLAQMDAAKTLAILLTTPGRPHSLKGNRAGTFSIDLDGPTRLLFEPIQDPLPSHAGRKELDPNNITAVRILSIEDTHD